MDESALRKKTREAIQNGKLPRRAPDRTWGGPGVGAPCAVCGLPVGKEEMEFEIEFARDGSAPGLDKYHVHMRCFAVWELERTAGIGLSSLGAVVSGCNCLHSASGVGPARPRFVTRRQRP